MIRVLLVDDDLLVRSGLRALQAEADITVVGEAADGREAVSRAQELRPDVVVMDVRMPRMDGVAATREMVSWPRRPRVLVLTTFDQDEVVDDALDAGADGFLLKRATPSNWSTASAPSSPATPWSHRGHAPTARSPRRPATT